MSTSKIEWLRGDDGIKGKSWNVITGCTPVSEGCANCYARRMANRLRGRCGYPKDDPFRVTFHPERLNEPVHWKKSCRVFACSMGDIFHPEVSFDSIRNVFQIMWGHGANDPRPWHTFIVLTKRPKRMAEYFRQNPYSAYPNMKNVWLGVSAENQKWIDIRLPIALQIPAAKHIVSLEPLLSEIDIVPYLDGRPEQVDTLEHVTREMAIDAGDKRLEGAPYGEDAWEQTAPAFDWVIVGCESGSGRRPCELSWIRSIVKQCKALGVPCFVKQVSLNGRVSHDMNEWPEELRVREYPK